MDLALFVAETSETDVDLTPLDIIRSETALSRYPIHNLSTKDGVRIEIKHKDDHGATILSWEVSYNSRYGPPGRLAYKLDTIIINRRIEEAGKPVPKLIRLGTLREIATQVLAGEKNTHSVKKALLQNASAFINARITYRTTEKAERSLEAAFSRYSVIFTGEQLPNGHKADGVYLVLNDIYMDVLNNALLRPLDYDYLRELAPSEQRFYEIISYQILPALKYNHRARLVYSDYCAMSTQVRCTNLDHVKKQMYKVLRPHLRSGYLVGVEYEAAPDSDGSPDWVMHFTPGPKARNEQLAFAFPGLNARKRREAEQQALAAAEAIRVAEAATAVAEAAGVAAEMQTALALPLPDRASARAAKNDSVFTSPPEELEPISEPTGKISALSETNGYEIGEPEFMAEAEAEAYAEANPSETPAMELARRFYETFHHNGTTARPTPRELAQAQDALDRLGLEGAQHLVAFAYRAAQKTRFAIQTFGGILQYESAAAAESAKTLQKSGKAQRSNARKGHQEAFYGAYTSFLASLLAQGGETVFPEAYSAFLSYEQKMRKFWKDRASKSEQSAEIFQTFDLPEQRVERFLTFVRDKKLSGVPDFWEWDAAHNARPFREE